MIADALTRLTSAILRRAGESVRTAVVARLEAYDVATQTARALPSVSESMPDGSPIPPTALHEIPVIHHGGSLRGLTFGLEPGDPVVLLVRHRSHQEIDAGAQAPTAPHSSVRMSPSESVALPGYVVPAEGQPAAHYRDDGQIVIYIDAGEAVHIGVSTAGISISRDDLVQAELSAIASALTTLVGTITTWSAAIVGIVGTAYVPPPTSYSPGSTATDRIKVDS